MELKYIAELDTVLDRGVSLTAQDRDTNTWKNGPYRGKVGTVRYLQKFC